MAGLTAPLLGLEKKSLREQALSALRTAITSGELEPGRHLVETELSEMLQISRGTLREALRQLEQEGLLSAGPRGRLSVRHLDEKEIRDIFAVRAALESLAARTLCEIPDRAQLIQSLHQTIDVMEAAQDASLEERVESDMEFHRTLCRLTGNETLLHSWESLGRVHPHVHHVRRLGKGRQEHEREPAPRNRRCHRNRRRITGPEDHPRTYGRCRHYLGVLRTVSEPARLA